MIHCLIFPRNTKKDSLFVTFPSWLGKIFILVTLIGTIFALPLPATGVFNFLLHTVPGTLLPSFRLQQLEINSNRSTMTTVTYQTSAQSKTSIRNITTRLVSRTYHTGVVANVDFKLFCSETDSHRTWRKIESSSGEVKMIEIGAERRKIFPTCLQKGTNGLSFFALEGKIKQRFRISA